MPSRSPRTGWGCGWTAWERCRQVRLKPLPIHRQKAPQIEKYPEIHDLVDKIMLAASASKQNVRGAARLKPIDLAYASERGIL